MPTNDLPAAAAEMLDLFQDALSTHVYSMEDGETPPIDCPMVATIQRMRNALELPPMLTPWIDPRDPAEIATAAGWLVEPDFDGDEVNLTARATPGTYTFGPWLTDLMPPVGAVYQWRLGKGRDGYPLFVQRDGTPLCDGAQYRIATITPQDGAAPALPSDASALPSSDNRMDAENRRAADLMRPRSEHALIRQCEAFNRFVKVGDPVWMIRDDKTRTKTTVRAPAEVLSGHTAVVWLEGVSGCYALDRVTQAEG